MLHHPPEIPTTAGVYVLATLKGGHRAYVGRCANLRHRAAVWAYHFRKQAEDASHTMPAMGLPVLPSHEWLFVAYPGRTVEDVRAALVAQNYTIINQRTRVPVSITYAGRTLTLGEHAANVGLPYTTCYKRWQRGKTPAEIFSKPYH